MANQRRKRPSYYWDGIQFPLIPISTTGIALILVDSTALEFMPRTLVRICGNLTIINNDSDSGTGSVDVGLKIVGMQVTDAGTTGEDINAIDTHEEDIARRQLWTHYVTLGDDATGSGGSSDNVKIEVDVRVKLKLSASGKMLLALFGQSSIVDRANISGYLRCLLRDN